MISKDYEMIAFSGPAARHQTVAVKVGNVTLYAEPFRCARFCSVKMFVVLDVDVPFVFVPLVVVVVVPGGTTEIEAVCPGKIPKFRILSRRRRTTGRSWSLAVAGSADSHRRRPKR